jgi:transcriptional regulator with XRE-family HTH domain
MPGRRADENDAVVGHNIRAHRLAKRMSQTGLGALIGVTFQQVQKYEKGVNRVGSGRLVRVADALGVPVTRLLDGVSGGGHGADAASPLALIASARPMRLVQAFSAIGDDGVRRSLMNLTEAIARLGEGGREPVPRASRHRARRRSAARRQR